MAPKKFPPSITCPSCDYKRLPHDLISPHWQCPRCKRGYPKHLADDIPEDKDKRWKRKFGKRYSLMQKSLWVALVVTGLLYIFSNGRKGYRIPVSKIDPSLYQEPVQTRTKRVPFHFSYRGEVYSVQPLRDYKLWGLVVSHNDINSLWDSYHDENSVDTKDLCVIWGKNVKTTSFHNVIFKSGSFHCYWMTEKGGDVIARQLSNNHLIANSDEVRKVIAKVRRGDQVYIKGSLVAYKNTKHRFWRTSSLTRLDNGTGACEVIFVDSIEIISRGTPDWYIINFLTFWLLWLFLLAKVALVGLEVFLPVPEKEYP